jgi:3'-phosphoadenosine 5'-phosphosulfate sulfotransferase (PAPS reductase)/FAD synthetase
MAEVNVRKIDRLDLAPRFTEQDAIRLNNMFRGSSTDEMLRTVIGEHMVGDLAVVSSFGAESAALLHLVASVDPSVPVLFLDTGRHFPETLAYRDALVARLGFKDFRNLEPDAEVLAARDAEQMRWSFDPDGCCDIRKVVPLAKGLAASTRRSPAERRSRRARATRCRASSSTLRTSWAASRSTRSPTGPAPISTPISSRTICRPIRWWRRAISRSAARRAPAWSSPARTRAPAAGAASTRPSAASTRR